MATYLQHSVGPADGHGLVGEQGYVHIAKAALLTGPLTPGQVGEVRVGGAGNHLTTNLTELLSPIKQI
jgi:hypothetical protein